MTIKEFAENCNVTEKTVKSWIENGYITASPPNESGERFIAEYMRAPYTEAKAKKQDAIYKSILNGLNMRKNVFPKLYGISKEDFESIIRDLQNNGLINEKCIDGYTYYDITFKGIEYKDKTKTQIMNLLTGVGTIVTTITSISTLGQA